MRFSAVICLALAALAAGCPASRFDSANAEPGGGDDDGVGGGLPRGSCTLDVECELVSSSCCECPTFATTREDPIFGACEGIACPTPPTCAGNVRAACDQMKHECTVACVEMACPTACPDGFAIDPATGCLSCECAIPVPGCIEDRDCVETREDCCGCARGGRDTAVLASEQATLDQMLGCPASPQCPGLDTCNASAEPRCVQGACVLTAATPPAATCTGTCPGGGVCTVNRDPAASELGVGVCVPP